MRRTSVRGIAVNCASARQGDLDLIRDAQAHCVRDGTRDRGRSGLHWRVQLAQ